MAADNEKTMISISEIADTLGWRYSTVASILARKSPADKLKIVRECEQNLINAKEALRSKFQNQ